MKVTAKDIELLINEHGLTACFECGKCTALCPMSEMFGDLEFGYTPRAIVEKALFDSDLVTSDAIWYCLTCDVCTKGCPCDVKFRDFIQALRQKLMDSGQEEFGVRCTACKKYFLPDPALKAMLSKMSIKGDTPDYMLVCPKCRTRDFGRRMIKSLTPGGEQLK